MKVTPFSEVGARLGAERRSVSELQWRGKPARRVTLERTYDTTVDDLWDALTRPARIARWLCPVEGDLTLGGHYQLEGNASGEITACTAPACLALTWVYGEETSWVEARLSEVGVERAHLSLSHTAPLTDHWVEFGPGATGVGWDLGLLGLELHIQRPSDAKLDEAAFVASAAGRAFVTSCSEAWGRAAIAAGTPRDAALAAAQRTAAFYTGMGPEPA